MTHTITILGSTGSIGRQTLSVAEELGLRVAALTAEKNMIDEAQKPLKAFDEYQIARRKRHHHSQR